MKRMRLSVETEMLKKRENLRIEYDMTTHRRKDC